MAARHAEFALGFWLFVSPFVLGHVDDGGLLVHDLVAGAVIMTVALLCYAPSLSRAHLLLLAAATELVAYGWWSGVSSEEVVAAGQNHVLVGLMVAMLALVPSRAGAPPVGWRDVPDADE